MTNPDWPADLARREAAYEALDEMAQPTEYRAVPERENALVVFAAWCCWPIAAVGFVFAAALLMRWIGG